MTLVYQAVLPPEVAARLAHLPPGVKRAVKAALRAITDEPSTGEPLRGELEGRLKYRVRRYRIIYRIDRTSRTVRIVAIGHRRTVYEELAEELKKEG